MNRQLLQRRELAADRHDAALAADPTRASEGFRRELHAVIEELTRVSRLAALEPSDPAEAARTYRYAGNAWFDLAAGKEPSALAEASAAFERAEQLVGDGDPVERAKLDFGIGNTLYGLSGSTDVTLLENALARYERAREAFAINNLPDLAAIVDQPLSLLSTQLPLARHHAQLRRHTETFEEASKQLEQRGDAAAEDVEQLLAYIRSRGTDAGVASLLARALAVARQVIAAYPERFPGQEMAQVLESLIAAFVSTAGAMVQMAQPQQMAAFGAGLIQMLESRVRGDLAGQRITPYRASALLAVLAEYKTALQAPEGDVDTASRKADSLRDIQRRFLDIAANPSWEGDLPAQGSVARRAIGILSGLTGYLLGEATVAMLPVEEADARLSLLKRRTEVEAELRRPGNNDRLPQLEGDTWRLALEIQEYARRHHLTLAWPIFARSKDHAPPRSVFLSGGEELSRLGRWLEQVAAFTIFDQVTQGERAQGRWKQLRAASVAVFDVGGDDPGERATACYEAGLALALGKPIVVITRPKLATPFDIGLRPVELSGGVDDDAEQVRGAIEATLGAITWGGAQEHIGSGAREALALLDARFGSLLARGAQQVARGMAERNLDDAVGFRRSVEQLLGLIGADAPALLLPAWPPAYPDPVERPRCFHVTPFRPAWALETRELVRAACRAKDWEYSRGDESEEQRVIPGIWLELSRASAVLVDITGRTPNVALELGLAHAMGRPSLVVAQGDPVEHLFPAIEKIQVRSYGSRPEYSNFTASVDMLLSLADSRSRQVRA